MTVIQSKYSNAKSRVEANGQYSEYFKVNFGVQQGFVISPLLFNLVLEALSKKFITRFPWELLYTRRIA